MCGPKYPGRGPKHGFDSERVFSNMVVLQRFSFCGAGDGNRTRTVSLGMETMPAWAHGGQGQSCPYVTVSARQGSFADR